MCGHYSCAAFVSLAFAMLTLRTTQRPVRMISERWCSVYRRTGVPSADAHCLNGTETAWLRIWWSLWQYTRTSMSFQDNMCGFIFCTHPTTREDNQRSKVGRGPQPFDLETVKYWWPSGDVYTFEVLLPTTLFWNLRQLEIQSASPPRDSVVVRRLLVGPQNVRGPLPRCVAYGCYTLQVAFSCGS
ncbi:hypothetical protein BKA93DRAFT_877412 [Sparassis latifolia]